MNRLSMLCAAIGLTLLAGAAAAQPAVAPPDPARGKAVFDRWCAMCHAAGPMHGGTAALEVKYHGDKPPELERRTDLTPDVVRLFVRRGMNIMPPFRKTEVGDADLEALAAYLSAGPAR